MTYDRGEIIRQTAALVAQNLPGYSVDTTHTLAHGAYVDGPEGARLFIRAEGYSDNVVKLTVSGVYPDGGTPYDMERPSIGVGAKRGPDAIAREITRRLLPAYLSELARVREWQARQTDALTARKRAGELLADALPGGSVDRQQSHRNAEDVGVSVRWHTAGHGTYGYADISHDGTRVSEMKLRGITVETALRIAALLRDDN